MTPSTFIRLASRYLDLCYRRAHVGEVTPWVPTIHDAKAFRNHRYIAYSYRTFHWQGQNIGDWIQTLATTSAIKRACDPDAEFVTCQRDELVHYEGAPTTCVMQGWYSHNDLNFLPSKDVQPVWVGTHFSRAVRFFLKRFIRLHPYFIMLDEIGCRDLSMVDFCKSLGIKAYYSRCLTLTLPRQEQPETAQEVFCVDCPDHLVNALPASLGTPVRFSQRYIDIGHDPADMEAYPEKAKEVLEMYRTRAKLVITTALHCAQPCAALGIPVVFINPGRAEVDRYSSMKGVLPLYTLEDLKAGRIDFSPKAPNFEPLKEALLENLKLSIARAQGHTIDHKRLEEVRTFIRDFSIC